MKRILSLLTVFVLAFSLCVPALAVSGYNYYGSVNLPTEMILEGQVYNLKDYVEAGGTAFIYVDPYDDYKGPVLCVGVNATFESTGVSAFVVDAVKLEPYSRFHVNSASDVWSLYDTGETFVHEANEVVWSSVDIYSASTDTVILHADNNFVSCDGSSCPANDMNFDDICDDCGKILAYNLRVVPNTYEVVVKHSDSLTIKYVYTETYQGTTFNAVYDDERITVTFDNPVNHYQYKWDESEWVLNSSFPNTSGSHVISLSSGASILSSDLNVYDVNGDIFFQNPLWMMVEQATQGGMKEATAEVSGTMTTLTLCGVGLMACLVVFALFGKRWLIFLR